MERLTIAIPGPFPSLNDYISSERRNRYAAAKVKRYQTERAARYAGEAARKFGAKLPFAKPVIVGFHWFEPDNRRDVDNIVSRRSSSWMGSSWQECSGTIRGDGLLECATAYRPTGSTREWKCRYSKWRKTDGR